MGAPDPDAQRYARHWEPVLAAAGRRLLARIDGSPGVVLDLGAGTGALALAAGERWPDARVIGVDASAGMLSVARHRVQADGPAGEAGRYEWLAVDAAAIPIDDGTVDLVTSAFMLQLVPDRLSVLAEVRRVLRQAGTFAIVSWLAEELLLEADVAFDEAVYELDVDEPASAEDPADGGEYASLEEARQELLAAGFRDVQVIPDQLEHAWSRDAYGFFKEEYDERDLFESLSSSDRSRLRELVAARWAELPDEAFTLRTPLVAAIAR